MKPQLPGRAVVRECVPPCLLRWARKQFGGIRVVSEWPLPEDGGWAEGAQAAAQGYGEAISRITTGQAISFRPEQEPLAWVSSDPQFHHLMVQFALVVASLPSTETVRRILDYGGAFGAHVHALRRLLPHVRLDYTVCELPSFCEQGRKLNSGVRFVSSLSEAGPGYDLVYASSSVPYTQNWRALVAGLSAASKGKVFVTRTPFVFRSPSFIVVQHAYGTKYPGWVFNYQEFAREFEGLGFCLEETFVNGRGLAVRGASESNIHLGLLFGSGRNGGAGRVSP